MSEQYQTYLHTLINETSQLDICQDLYVIENSVKIRTSSIFVSFVFPYLCGCLIDADVVIIESLKSNTDKEDISSCEVFHDVTIDQSDPSSVESIGINNSSPELEIADSQEHICQYCPSMFSDKRKLSVHINQRHVKALKCSECDMTFPNKSELNYHTVKHSNIYRECTICNIKIKHERNFKRHMSKHSTTSKSLKCNLCEKTFSNQSDLNTHLNIHYHIKFPCKKCHKEYSNKRNLARHKCSVKV